MLGDFYPLFPHLACESVWYGFQFHRPDLDAGFALVFRRKDSPYVQAELPLKGVHADGKYLVTYEDRPDCEEVPGKGLFAYPVRIPAAPDSALVHYRRR